MLLYLPFSSNADPSAYITHLPPLLFIVTLHLKSHSVFEIFKVIEVPYSFAYGNTNQFPKSAAVSSALRTGVGHSRYGTNTKLKAFCYTG